jgi:hypothetical protein
MANLGMSIDDLDGLGFGYEDLKPNEKKKQEIYDDREIIIVDKEKSDTEISTLLTRPLIL